MRGRVRARMLRRGAKVRVRAMIMLLAAALLLQDDVIYYVLMLPLLTGAMLFAYAAFMPRCFFVTPLFMLLAIYFCHIISLRHAATPDDTVPRHMLPFAITFRFGHTAFILRHMLRLPLR